MEGGKSWASIAETPALEAEAKSNVLDVDRSKPCIVIDANALIGSHVPRSFLGNLVTTEDVEREVRDKRSKEALQALPFGLSIREPTKQSMAAVTKFARATGETHALSLTDLRLIALAHSLHVARHGQESLREVPQPARASRKGGRGSEKLPGWGDRGGTWAELDKMDETRLAAKERAHGKSSGSKIAARIQNLQIADEPSQPGSPIRPQETSAVLSPPPVQVATPSRSRGKQPQPQRVPSDAVPEASGEDWEVAPKSRNAGRRKKRKDTRRAARQAERDLQNSLAAAETSVTAPATPPKEASAHAPAIETAPRAVSAEIGAADDSSDDDGEAEDSVDESSGPEGGSSDDDSSEGEGEGLHDGASEIVGVCGVTDAAPAAVTGRGEGEPQVMIVTADFAMQNVILQMGLRLVAPDGRRIWRIRSWVLRCSACFKVTKEMERLFCPTCGNAALEKVEVVIDDNGAEQYGVRRRHVIRGTKFALPRPKGGARNQDPILREDVLLQRMPRKKPKETSTDPFVPEYTAASWHDLRGSGASSYHKGLEAVLASHKHNPNERKHVRSNRRK